MSNKTFFEEIKPHILEEGEVLTTEQLEDLAEKHDEIGEEYADDTDWVFDSVDLDKYYLTASPCNILAEVEALMEFHRAPDDVVYVPKFLKDKPEMFKNIYRGVMVDGKAYRTNHRKITQASDTHNYIKKKDAYEVEGRGYYENNTDLVHLGNTGKWAKEDDVVMTEDMGYRWYKHKCYVYHDDDNEKHYYRYRNMAPDAGHRIMRFKEANFPEPDDIEESRIGIEFEYQSAVDASVQALKSPHLRSRWNSVRDGSIVPNDIPRDQEKATEFVSIPFTINEVGEEVYRFMDMAHNYGARVNEKCGFHVHIGNPGLDFHDLTSLVVLCENIEKDLFRLVPDHRQNNEFCKRLDGSFEGFRKYHEGMLDTEEEVADMFYEGKATAESRARQGKWRVDEKRHYWLSVDRFWYCKDEPHKRTVEFRMHHATHDAEKFLQFVFLCYYIAQYAFNNNSTKCVDSDLDDVVESIKNPDHREQVLNLLRNKKVISKR